MDSPYLTLLAGYPLLISPLTTTTNLNMNCYVCNTPLIWGGDEDAEEGSDHKIVTNLSCPKCESFVLVHHGK